MLLGFIFTSCEDDNPTISSADVNVSNSASTHPSYTGVWNPNNPFDSLGYHHNDLVLQMLNYVDTSGIDINLISTSEDFTAMLSSVGGYISQQNGFSSDSTYMSNSINNLLNFASDSRNSNSYDFFMQLTNSDSISSTELDILTAVDTNGTLSTLVNDIVNYENTISSKSYLTSHQKDILFGTASVLKFSLTFWHNENTNPNSLTRKILNIDQFEDVAPFFNPVSAAFWDAFEVVEEATQNSSSLGESIAAVAVSSLGGGFIGPMASSVGGVWGMVGGMLYSLGLSFISFLT